MKNLLLIALLSVLTASVCHAANDPVVVDGVTYEWYENSITHEYGYMATGWDEETPIQSLHILGIVDGYQVYGISDGAFEDNEDIIYLTIDEGITSIGENAFCRCYNLEVAILPEGLVTIEEEAFAFCNSLTTMVIPSTVEEIQSHAFSGCTGVTDVYFLMDSADQLDYFNWWDGVYPSPGEDEHGGMEFNTNQNTIVHVPAGTYDIYDDSGKLEAWLFQEDSGSYPLWWIVNYGVVGHEYTVSDDLTAVYVDVEGGLYAKDDNHWLTPDKVYTDEIDYMSTTGLMKDKNNQYDQSNWVVLTNVEAPDGFIGYLIKGETISGILKDKMNPVIEVSDGATLEIGDQGLYEKNVYIPASFMGRAQISSNGKTYAFVQPKPQELLRVEWTIYSEDDECFYLPEPDGEDINSQELAGGIKPCYDLYEGDEMPVLEDCGYYAFDAINRLKVEGGRWKVESGRVVPRSSFHIPRFSIHAPKAHNYTPYTAGGVSDMFVVYPLELPDEPIPTDIYEINVSSRQTDNCWYTIDGRNLGTTKPTLPGIYINGNHKVVIR